MARWWFKRESSTVRLLFVAAGALWALAFGGEMTKAELVEEVARAAELTKKDSEVIVEEVFKNIIQALNRGEKIELRGFGSFRVRQRDARRGRNPKTGAPVDIPAKRVPYFKPGKELKELINAEVEAATPAAAPPAPESSEVG